MDFWTFLGGLTMGAAAAAIFDMSSSPKTMMGDALDEEQDQNNLLDPPGGVSASVGPSSGGGGGGPGGVFVGPPGGGGGGMAPSGPSVSVMPSVQTPMAPPVGVGPTVSVTPEVQPGAFDESFFGVSAPPWFWPLNYWPYQVPQNQSFICKKQTTPEGQDTFVCEPRYPVQNVAYTYGPPGYW